MHRLAFASLTLAACLGPAAQAAEAPHDPNAEGIAFFSMPKNRAGDFLVLRSVKSATEYRLGARSLGKEGRLGSVSWLPAGDYQLVGWSGAKLADYPTLTIEAGRLTDGGTLIALPVGDRKLVLLPVRPEETAHDVDAALLENGAALTHAEPLLWQVKTPPNPVDLPAAQSPLAGVVPQLLATWEAHVNKATPHKRLLESTTVETFFAAAKESMPPLTSVAVSYLDGRSLYGADFGQIRVRSAAGEWSALDTGTLHPVTVVATDGPRLMAGYDDGSVRVSDDQGASWKLLPAPALGWRIATIEHTDHDWLLVAAHISASAPYFARIVDNLRVFTMRDSDLTDLRLLREFKPEEGTWIVPHAELDGGKLYLMVQPAVWRLDVGTGKWDTLPTPGDVGDFHLGDPGVLAAWRAKGMFSKLYVSKDGGSNWSKIDHPSLQISDVRMFDQEHGVAVRMNPGAFLSTEEIHEYDKARDEWRLVNTAPDGCLRLLVDLARRPRFCVTSGASILALADGKWVAEYSTQ